MREYKFRAWDNEANLMIYSDHRTRKLYDVYYGFEMDSKGELKCKWEAEWEESCPPDGGAFNNLMQYTGFKDDNGVEIYEGDIIHANDFYYDKYNRHVLDTLIIGQVAWDMDRYIVVMGETEWMLGELLLNDDEFKVIGNIYENPELLKEEL